jgi:hypothetical protein
MAARKGSKHHNAKLTNATVREARRVYANGSWIMLDGKQHPVNVSNLARKYGVSHQTMYSAIKGHTWRHVS